MKHRIIILATLLVGCAVAYAAPINDAKKLLFDGKYAEAVAILEPLVKSSPKDGTANYYLGLAYKSLGESERAKRPLEVAVGRGIAGASQALAEISLAQYDVDAASSHIDMWEKQLRKDKKNIPDELKDMRSSLITIRNMLERVEKIVIVDSLVVDKQDFFKHYRLTKDAGSLMNASVLPDKYASTSPKVVYEPENKHEMFWAMPSDEDGLLTLVSASVLDDGKTDAPVFMSKDLNEGGDADYPFVMPDGITFYFANNGENSIGGYDIFMSRRSADGSTLQPQNIGMPYNSPFDDYMLAIDEASGLGWWATDRNQIPDKVTIYVFKPNETRVNYDPEDENIADYAFIRSIAATQEEGFDPKTIWNDPIWNSADQNDKSKYEFTLYIGDGRIYHSLSDFKNPQARSSMSQYLLRAKELNSMQAELDSLRARYAKGEKGLASQITTLEKRVQAARPMLKKLRNNAISQERASDNPTKKGLS